MASEFTRFVILLNGIQGKTATPEQIKGHVAFLRQLDKEKRLVLCGPFTNYAGGMVIIKAGSLEEAKEISNRDPFVKEGIRMPEIRTWELSCEENNHLGRG